MITKDLSEGIQRQTNPSVEAKACVIPGQLRALFVQDPFEDGPNRLDLHAHGINIDRDRVDRNGRALIEAVQFTGVSEAFSVLSV